MALRIINNTGDLQLSAVDLKNMVKWPSALIEDYLNLNRVLSQVTQFIDVDLGTMAFQNAYAVDITGGTLNGITIGNTVPALNIITQDITVLGTATVENAVINNLVIEDISLENLTVIGDTILGDSATDSLVIAPEFISWLNNPMHGGNHTFQGSVTIEGAFTSPGIDDNATTEQIDITDSLVTISQNTDIGVVEETTYVSFDGTNDWLSYSSALTGVPVGSKFGTIAARIKINGGSGNRGILWGQTGAFVCRFIIETGTNILSVSVDPVPDAPAAVIIESVTGYTTSDGWLNILISWDCLNDTEGQLYVNDVDDYNATTSDLDNDPLCYDQITNWAVGASQSGTLKFNGDIAFLWVDFTTAIDFSIEANRRLFFDASGFPVPLGSSGQIPTGTSPILYFNGDTNFETNKGTGSGFTLNGSLIGSASDYGVLHLSEEGYYTDSATGGPIGVETFNSRGYYQDGVYVPTISSISTLTNKTINIDNNTLTTTGGVNGETLIYSAISGKFESAALTAGNGISITNAAGSITIAASSANEATDTTCFPLFITASGTQTLQPKNNTSFTFNSSSAQLGAASISVTGSTVAGNSMYLPAASTLGWSIGGAAEMQLTSTALSPATDGGSSLGTTALGWQNLFANTGFVLNIENGNWVATHTSGILTVGTGDLRITTAGTNSASVLTVNGSQDVLNKTNLQVDNININGNTISSTAGVDLFITPLAGQQLILDGTIEIDAGIVTGATSISSTDFLGNLNGTLTVTDTADSTCNVALFESATGNLPPKTDAALTYDATTGTLTAPTFSGSLTGAASQVVVVDAASDTTTWLLLAGSQTGAVPPLSDGSLTYNASTDTLSTVNLTLSGNLQVDGNTTLGNGTTDTVTINSINGIDYNPGSNTNVDLITVGVTGTPLIRWLNASVVFEFNKGMLISSNGNCTIQHSDLTRHVKYSADGFSNFTGAPVLDGAIEYKNQFGATWSAGIGNNDSFSIYRVGTRQLNFNSTRLLLGVTTLSTTGNPKLDIVNGNAGGIVLGLSDIDTDVTNKASSIVARHYTNSEEPLGIVITSVTSTDNTISYGGSVSTVNAATIHRFYTGATNTTTTGTERFRIQSSGNGNFLQSLRIGGAGGDTPASKLEIYASNDGLTGATANNTLRLTDSDTTTAANQANGLIEFYGSDATSPGARVMAYFYSAAKGTTGGGDLRFGTSANAGTVAENMRLITTGLRIGDGTDATAMLDVFQPTLGTAIQSLTSTASNDDPNEITYQQKVTTTDGTITTIATIAVPASTTVMIEARVTARRTGGAAGTAEDGAAYIIAAAYKNVAGTATEIGEGSIFSAEDQGAWSVTFTPSGSNTLMQVTGATDNNISWIATYRTYSISS